MQRRLLVPGGVMPVVVQRHLPGHGFRLSLGPSSCASPRKLLEEFLILGLLALFALETWCILLLRPVSGSLPSVSGCCMWNTDHWILREMTWSMGAMLGSTVDMGLRQYLAFDEFHTISTLPWTRILKRLVFVLTQNGEDCSADASVFGLRRDARTLEIWIFGAPVSDTGAGWCRYLGVSLLGVPVHCTIRL